MHPNVAVNAASMTEAYLPREADYEIPFLAEPIKAYRCWTIDYLKDKDPLLRSITYKIRWPIRAEMRAHCLVQWSAAFRKNPQSYTTNVIRHTCPNQAHRCGVYSLKDKEQLREWSGNNKTMGAIRISGSVLIWGKVFEYEKGWISEYAYPLEIFEWNGNWPMDPDTTLPLIAEKYGIALEI